MDRRKSRGGKSQGREEKRREERRGEETRRDEKRREDQKIRRRSEEDQKKMQVCEKVEKSRNTVFFSMFCGSGRVEK